MIRKRRFHWSVPLTLVAALGCGAQTDTPDRNSLTGETSKPTKAQGALTPVSVDREVQRLSKLANLTELQASKAKKVLDVVVQLHRMTAHQRPNVRERRTALLRNQAARGLSAVVTDAQQGSVERYVLESSLFRNQ
jgi:hypothetical protein